MKPPTSSPTQQFLKENILSGKNKLPQAEIDRELSYISKERINDPLIYVGISSCSIIAGAMQTFKAIESYLKEHHINAELVKGGCNGYCKGEPFVDIQMPGKARLSFANVHPEHVEDILDDILNNILPRERIFGQYKSPIHEVWPQIPFIDEHPFFKHQKRILLENCGRINPESIEEAIAMGTYTSFTKAIREYTPAMVCDILEDSKLTGRGGGAYLTGKKWKTSLQIAANQKFVICNAVESDPGSYMNRAIIESDPHRLIEAVLLSAYAVGASKAYIFIRKEFQTAIERLGKAIAQAEEYGLTGHNILNSGVNIIVSIKEGAKAFVCGEETALINAIEGKRAMPESKPPFPATKGLFDMPTIVNNVETLYNVPLILKHGAKWYQGIGTEGSKGTKLFTLSGKTKNFGTIEVPMGVSFRDVIEKTGQGLINPKKAFKAIILGINSGNYIVEETLDTIIDFEELNKIGSALGSGAFVVIDQSTCMVDLAKYFTTFFRDESCGKCIPCREGTARMLEILDRVTKRPASDESFMPLERFKGVMQLKPMAETIRITSLCALGKSSPNAILNTMKHFKDEIDAHIFERKCPAGVCRDLKVFSIDVDLCTGCTACYKKCPVDAIIGSPRNKHFIVEERCIGCGACYDACKFNAVKIK